MLLEQPYAIDVVTRKARLLKKTEGHRSYDLADIGPNEFYGTCDVVGTMSDGTPIVMDHKTGRDLGDPREKMQLRFFATAVHLLTDASEVEARFVYIEEDGATRNASARFSVLDFDETISSLLGVVAGIAAARADLAAGRQPYLHTGDHCRWCPAVTSCPAKTSLIRRLLPDLATMTDSLSLMTPEQLGAAWVQYKNIDTIMKNVGDLLKEFANNVELPLPNGKVLRQVASSRSSTDVEKLIRLAKRHGVVQQEIDGCKRTNTFSSLRECKK